MKKLTLALLLVLALAAPGLALDDSIYGTWTIKNLLSFTITNDWGNRCDTGYLYIPDNFESKAWHGNDSAGDYWAKSVIIDGNTVFFCEANATNADKNIPTSSWYKLEFDSSMSKFTLKGVTSTYTPGTYYIVSGTGTK